VSEGGRAIEGDIFAYSIEPETGELKRINQATAPGEGKAYITIDHSDSWVMAASYSSGMVMLLPIEDKGKLGEVADVVQHSGSGPNEKRQDGPHAHCIEADPSNRFAVAVDLGIDRLMVYRLDEPEKGLLPGDIPFFKMEAGSGPRHIAFHPDGSYAYVINELNSTAAALRFDPATGSFGMINVLSTAPDHFNGTNFAADIHIHPSGRFVYGSNRGHDSIVIYSIHEDSGAIQFEGTHPTGGEAPRNFCIDPSGRFLLVGNQDTDTIVTLEIDEKTGRLRETGVVTEVPTPVCLKMISLSTA
jgi:6-phosphogluconolactonase